jgi:dUTP pyrophosphatase
MTRNKVVKIVNKSTNPDPEYAHPGDSGFDLRAWIPADDSTNRMIQSGCDDSSYSDYSITMEPLETRLIHTGIYVQLPPGCEGQVRARSGVALKQNLMITNGIGSIDLNYSGEVGVILTNVSNERRTIVNGDRIAQFVVCPVYNSYMVDLEMTDELEHQNNKERGNKGFGSSGIK